MIVLEILLRVMRVVLVVAVLTAFAWPGRFTSTWKHRAEYRVIVFGGYIAIAVWHYLDKGWPLYGAWVGPLGVLGISVALAEVVNWYIRQHHEQRGGNEPQEPPES